MTGEKYSVDGHQEDLEQVAAQILAHSKHRLLLLIGEMGAGKTTLIKALGKNLGVKDPITSPTFSLVNQYKAQSGETIYHFDWYRIEDEEEAEAIGFYEYVDSQAYCFMEWPEKISTLIPDDYTKVEISINSDGSRHFSVMNQSHE